jgi:UDP-2,3-diacylglucosamine pyrophosphatase LpxH
MGKTIIMSDIHFGSKDSNLSVNSNYPEKLKAKRKGNINKLFDWFATLHEDIDEFIFLGDIFDLHLYNFSEALSNSYYFFDKISSFKNISRITYIPGNHDHTLWLLHIYSLDIIKKFELNNRPEFEDDIEFVDREFKDPDSPSFLKKIFTNGREIEFCVRYPIFHYPIDSKHIAFFHGHFLDKRQRVIEQVLKFALPNLDLSVSQEYELFCCPQYETIFLLSQCKAGRDELSKRYKKYKKYIDEYRVPVHYHHQNIRLHLKDSGLKIGGNPIYRKLHYVIFGHTHTAGISMYKFSTNEELIGMNTGSWVQKGDILGEFIMIDRDNIKENHPVLYVYNKKQEHPVFHDEYISLKSGVRPINRVYDEKLAKKWLNIF